MQGDHQGGNGPKADAAPHAATMAYGASRLVPDRKPTVGYGNATAAAPQPAVPLPSAEPTPLETGATVVAAMASTAAAPWGGSPVAPPIPQAVSTETIASAATAQTMLASSLAAARSPMSLPMVSGSPATLGRCTVLPRVRLVGDEARVVVEPRERYEEQKTLGAGGVGVVVAARDHDIERDVAMKRLLPEMQGPEALARFVEEIRTVGKLEHPNIVPIHDVGIDHQGRYFFVMKHIEGETLEHIISRLAAGDREYHGKYGFERRAQIFQGILEAIRYAHEQGILHRDIKPANIMVGAHGEVVVMDWGIAKRLGSGPEVAGTRGPAVAAPAMSTTVGSVIGTPAYMSPEQARGENDKLDERSDIYSLCVLFWELLTLRHYLDGKNTLEEILAGVVSTPAPHPSRFSHPIQGSVPADLGWFTLAGLQKVPSGRYGSVSAMISRLQLRNEGIIPIQCPLTFTKRMTHIWSRFVDRHPAVLIAGLTLFALCAAGSVVWGVVRVIRAALAG